MPIRSEKPRRPNTIASRIMAISTTIRNTMKPRIATTPQPAEGRGRSRSAVFIAGIGSGREPDQQGADEDDHKEVADGVDSLSFHGRRRSRPTRLDRLVADP